MSASKNRECEIFNAALDVPAGAGRADLLDEICGNDAGLRQRVELLLRSHDSLGSFLRPADGAPDAAPVLEGPGTRVGRYELLERIGEGGFGVVYLAEQEEPVRRRVALKIIKLGMDTRAVVARFEAERQALAMMDHPHIAKVLDGGATDTGRPYFVMELVSGVPLTRFCDAQRLSVAARLELLMQVCHAVQHAHQKGIIHRDLKPSNILVVERDGRPVPSVIDFGIAKATGVRLTAETTLTRAHQYIGTPAYMSPEQAGLVGLDIDTRSDIYSLGVLLYELLAGHTPFDGGMPAPGAGAVAARPILERDPPTPSQRFASLAPEARTVVARQRRLDPARLAAKLRGDLGRIVMKCVESDRVRRYDSVSNLSLDLGRYLRNEPVLARPDSAGYRLRKFVRRHRRSVLFAAVVGMTLMAGFVATLVQAHRANFERRRAGEQRDFALRQLSRAEAINDLNMFLVHDAAPLGRPFTAVQLLERAANIMDQGYADNDENRVELLVAIGRQFVAINEIARARPLLGKAYELSRQVGDQAIRARAAAALGDVIAISGDFDRGEELIQESLAELGTDPKYALERIFCLGRGSRVARERGDVKTGVERMEEALRVLRASGQTSTLRELEVNSGLAEAYRMAGRSREAAAMFAAAHAQLVALGRDKTDQAASLLNNWANSLVNLGRVVEAERLFRRVIAIRSADGTEDSLSSVLLHNMAGVLRELGRFDEAADYADRACAKARQSGEELGLAYALRMRADIAVERGERELAMRLIDDLEPKAKAMPENYVVLSHLTAMRAQLLAASGDSAKAVAEANHAVALIEQGGGSPEYRGLSYMMRARVNLMCRQPEAARIDAARALAVFGQSPGTETPSARLGRAMVLEAEALAAEGWNEEASALFASALPHLEPTLGRDHPLTQEAAQGIVDVR